MAVFDLPLGTKPRPLGEALSIPRFEPTRLRISDVTEAKPRVVAPRTRPFAVPNVRELDIHIDTAQAALWCFMRPQGPPSFTPSLLRELIALRRALQEDETHGGLRYFIGASRLPGIYNLGGDLQHFVAMIRAQDRDSLRAYAIDCCDVAYHMAIGFNTPILTIGLVQGDALGGGFEGAMSFHILVAERSARLGLPEVLFNLFPGMGAMSFLSRKIGFARAERMILSGKIHTAEELYDMGVVDILAEDGEGEAELRKFLGSGEARYRLHRALAQARQRVSPVTFEELRDITDIWVETAMQLSESDLRRMERLALAQRRRVERS